MSQGPAIDPTLHALRVLGDRINDLEVLVRESLDEMEKLRKQFAELKGVVARKKQLKKLKKLLDQLEVIEVGEEAQKDGETTAPPEAGSTEG